MIHIYHTLLHKDLHATSCFVNYILIDDKAKLYAANLTALGLTLQVSSTPLDTKRITIIILLHETSFDITELCGLLTTKSRFMWQSLCGKFNNIAPGAPNGYLFGGISVFSRPKSPEIFGLNRGKKSLFLLHVCVDYS